MRMGNLSIVVYALCGMKPQNICTVHAVGVSYELKAIGGQCRQKNVINNNQDLYLK